MPRFDGTLIRVGNQVALRETSGAVTLMVAGACDPNAAAALFTGVQNGSPISVDGDKNTCQGTLLVNNVL